MTSSRQILGKVDFGLNKKITPRYPPYRGVTPRYPTGYPETRFAYTMRCPNFVDFIQIIGDFFSRRRHFFSGAFPKKSEHFPLREGGGGRVTPPPPPHRGVPKRTTRWVWKISGRGTPCSAHPFYDPLCKALQTPSMTLLCMALHTLLPPFV